MGSISPSEDSAGVSRRLVGRRDGSERETTSRLPLLLRTIAQAQQRMRNAAAGDGVTGTQISVMTAVVNNPGLDQRSVCRATFIDESTVASVVANLARRGLLTQTRSESDRRRYELRASREAWEYVYASQKRVLVGNAALLAPLAAARQGVFVQALERIVYADRGELPEQYVIPRPDGRGEPYRISWGLGRLVRAALQRHTRLWTAALDQPITPVQYLALRTIQNRGAMDQRALGEATLIDKATLTVLLQRLERSGLIDRVPDPEDRRRRLLAINPSARPLLRAGNRADRQVASTFLAPLTATQATDFLDALTLVAEHARREFLPRVAQRSEV